MEKIKKIKEKGNLMKGLATAIVKYRFFIMAIFLAAAIFCVMSISKVKVNEDITAFLPDDTETRQGLTIMEDEFITYGMADIMVSNITYEKAQQLADHMAENEHVTGVTLDDSKAHFVDSAALMSVSFDGTESDQKVIDAQQHLEHAEQDTQHL